MSKIKQNEIITKKLSPWNRVEALLEGDEEEIKKFAKRFPNESPHAFKERKETYNRTFINLSQDLVSAPGNSVFRQSIKNEFEKKNSLLEDFHKNVTLGNDPVPFDRFLKDNVAIGLRSYGNVFTVVDKPRKEVKNRQDERESGLPYLSNIRPQDVLDWEMIQGELLWFAYSRVFNPPWIDPVHTEKPDAISAICLWTKTDLFVLDNDGKIIPELSFTHNWNFVPVIIQASFLASTNDIIGQAAMNQTSWNIINMNDLLNLGVWELKKHGAALLAMTADSMSAQNFSEDKLGHTQLKKQDDDGVLPIEGEIFPQYLVKELEVDKMMVWAMFYAQNAIENERDLKSVVKKGQGSGGIVQQSGIAKMLDREPLESNLIALAEDLEIYTKKVDTMVSFILNETNTHIYEFDKSFDFRSLEQKFSEIKLSQEAGIKEMSPTLLKEQWKNTVPEVTTEQDTMDQINTEIEESNPEQDIDEITKNLVDSQFSNQFEKVEV